MAEETKVDDADWDAVMAARKLMDDAPVPTPKIIYYNDEFIYAEDAAD